MLKLDVRMGFETKKFTLIKRKVHSKNKKKYLFTHPIIVLNLYDFLSPAEYKRYLKNVGN